ncbi:MAG TPA: hypothetical protein VNN73_18835 [Blastocatellia bacterium]|nr:hypothetical protein [Blastocatellia bacterium]
MKAPPQKRLAGSRAVCAALLLLWCAASAPLALASSVPEVCSMSCCVKAGHCCCSPRRARVKGAASTGQTNLIAADLTPPCPEGCATSASFSLTNLRDLGCAATFHAELTGTAARSSHSTALLVDSTVTSLSARAPPIRPLQDRV